MDDYYIEKTKDSDYPVFVFNRSIKPECFDIIKKIN
jgi:hypothetical protein